MKKKEIKPFLINCIHKHKPDLLITSERLFIMSNDKMEKLTNEFVKVDIKKINTDFEFYKQSLIDAENQVESIYKRGKAYEIHRKRVWEYFGFNVTKDKQQAMFNVDWSILYNGILVALEEDKGHYLDSCFLERALSGFCKTINYYQKKEKKIPMLIIHSFTRYNKFDEKLKDDMDTRKTEIAHELNNKIVYTTLTNLDRLNKKKWFSKDLYNCYSSNSSNELILEDIEFIKSLIPVSE